MFCGTIAKLRFCFSILNLSVDKFSAKMDDQAHKPHRKSKERKEKKGKSGGSFSSSLSTTIVLRKLIVVSRGKSKSLRSPQAWQAPKAGRAFRRYQRKATPCSPRRPTSR